MRVDVSAHVQGIPCLVRVTHYYRQPADSRADNPDDYYGYTELEYDVLDRKGYPAPWLERKMTEDDVQNIEEKIYEHLSEDS